MNAPVRHGTMAPVTVSATQRYEPFPAFADWAARFDPSVADQHAALLEQAREGATRERLDRAVRVATRYAAVDTGAIEGLYTVDRGFTKTIATEAAAWEVALQQRGEAVARSIQDAIAGYDYVLDAVTQRVPLSEMWLRTLHEVLCQSQTEYTVYTAQGPQQQALPRATYKTMPNSPTNVSTGRVHHDAPPEDTPAEMGRHFEELRGAAFATAHPVVQVAYAHYAFVCVHPFADGNGRVARALASVFLYRNPGVPLVVFADQRDQYLDALEAADRGDHAAFTSFVEQRTIDAIDLVTVHLRGSGRARDALEQLRDDATGRQGIAHAELDAVGSRILARCDEALRGAFADLEGPDISAGVGIISTRQRPVVPLGYRALPEFPGLHFALATTGPGSVRADATYAVAVARPGTPGPDFLVLRDGSEPFAVHLREIFPTETQLLTLKLSAWAEDEIGQLLELLVGLQRQALSRAGYLTEEEQA